MTRPLPSPKTAFVNNGGHFMRGMLFGLVVIGLAGCGGRTPVETTKAEITANAKAKTEAARERANVEAKPTAEQPKAAKAPPPDLPYRVNGFEQVWAAAKQLGKKLDDDVPRRTHHVLARLSDADRGPATGLANNANLAFAEHEAALLKYGLADLARSLRRRIAFEDPALGMEDACRTVWREGLLPEDYVAAAEDWRFEPDESKQDAFESLRFREYPQRRGGVRLIESLPGGKEWLEAKRRK